MGVVATEEEQEEEEKEEEETTENSSPVVKQPESIPACSLFLDRAATVVDPDIDEGLRGVDAGAAVFTKVEDVANSGNVLGPDDV